MRSLRVIAGALVPHAPLLLPEVGRRSEVAEPVIAAARNLHLGDPDFVVLVSPHGSRSGIYASVTGNLNAFGVPGVGAEAATDRVVAAELADTWRKPLLDEPVDHGVLVPLLLAKLPSVPIVAATLVEATGPWGTDGTEAIEDGRSFATAVLTIATRHRISFVASANTSAALTPRAPLGERPEALVLERDLRQAFAGDAAALDDLALDLWVRGGSCGGGPLAAFARVCAGAICSEIAYASPAGVGYPVVTAETR